MQVLLAKCARSESQAAFSRACANVRSSSPVSRTKNKTDTYRVSVLFFCERMVARSLPNVSCEWNSRKKTSLRRRRYVRSSSPVSRSVPVLFWRGKLAMQNRLPHSDCSVQFCLQQLRSREAFFRWKGEHAVLPFYSVIWVTANITPVFAFWSL